MKLFLVGKWKDLLEAISLRLMCIYHLVGFPWLLNVL